MQKKAIQEAQARMNQLKPLLGGGVNTVQTPGTHGCGTNALSITRDQCCTVWKGGGAGCNRMIVS